MEQTTQPTTTHHDLNDAVSLEFNQKRIERLKRKQKAKTNIERQRPFYVLILATAVLCELVDITLTFSGIVHFAATKLSDNGFILSVLAAVFVVLLGLFKHKTTDTYHAQRLDDEHVPNSTYVFLFVFFGVSTLATYNVTPAALEYLTKTPPLSSVDSVSNHYDTLLAADLVVISKEIEAMDSTKASLGNLSRTGRSAFFIGKTGGQTKITAVTLARKEQKEAAIKAVLAKNEAIIRGHKDWCVSFGFFLSFGFVLVELLYFPAKWFCANYERSEVVEANKKLEAIAKQNETPLLSPSDLLKNVTQPIDPNAQPIANPIDPLMVKANIPSIQIVTNASNQQGNPKAQVEGDVIKGEGRKADRVIVKLIDGEFRAMTIGQLNTLISAQSPGSSRVAHLESLKNLLK